MDRRPRCIEPRCLVLLIASVLFLPLRDSFHVAIVGRSPLSTTRRCGSTRQQQQQQQHSPIRSPGCTPLPTRRLPRLLRPLKGSGSEQADVTGNDDKQAAGEDDSIKVVDEPSAVAAAAAAAGGPVESTAEEDGGESQKEGAIRGCQHSKMPKLVPQASHRHGGRRRFLLVTMNTTPHTHSPPLPARVQVLTRYACCSLHFGLILEKLEQDALKVMPIRSPKDLQHHIQVTNWLVNCCVDYMWVH